MQVQFIGRTENEDRQEYVQEHVRIDVSSHVHSPSEKSGFRQEVLSVKHSDNEAETEKAYGIWNLELLEQRLQHRTDEQCRKHEKQWDQGIFVFHRF